MSSLPARSPVRGSRRRFAVCLLQQLNICPSSCLSSDLMERSLGVNTFQLAKKLVDRVISVRYCISTAHLHFQASSQWFDWEMRCLSCVKILIISPFYILKHRRLNSWVIRAILDYLLISNLMIFSSRGITWHGCCHLFPLPLPHSEEDSLVAMLRFQEFERSTVDTEGAMGLAAILAGQLPELRGKKWVRHVNITAPDFVLWGNSRLVCLF